MPKLSHDKQERRRAHILDSAEICFARNGFHRTTMVDICREAGISAGALYVYFDSKEALIDGLVERDREEITALLQSIGDAPNFFEALAVSLRCCVLERPAHKVALYIEMVAEAQRNPQVARSVRTCEETLRDLLAGLVERARATGAVAPHVDAAKMAMIMLLIGDALFMRRAANPDFDGSTVVPELMMMIRAVMVGEAGNPSVNPDLRADAFVRGAAR